MSENPRTHNTGSTGDTSPAPCPLGRLPAGTQGLRPQAHPGAAAQSRAQGTAPRQGKGLHRGARGLRRHCRVPEGWRLGKEKV